MKRTTMIAIDGGPGTGKSTVAAAVFSKLKKKLSNKSSIELVTEYAKDCIHSDWNAAMEKYQFHVISQQAFRLMRLNGKVDYVVTDGSLLLNIPYLDGFLYKETFSAFLLDLESQAEWWHYVLNPPTKEVYEKNNRREDFEWSLKKHHEIVGTLKVLGKYRVIASQKNIEKMVVEDVLAAEKLKSKPATK